MTERSDQPPGDDPLLFWGDDDETRPGPGLAAEIDTGEIALPDFDDFGDADTTATRWGSSDGGVGAGGERPGDADPDTEDTPAAEDTEEVPRASRSWRRRVGIALVALVGIGLVGAAGFVVGRVVERDDDGGVTEAPPAPTPPVTEEVATESVPPTEAATTSADDTTTTVSATTTEPTPVVEPLDIPVRSLPARGVVDSFRRPDDSELGIADSGATWFVESGSWAVSEGRAVVADRAEQGPNLAVVNMRSSDGLVQVTLSDVTPSAGLLFRYVNRFNYWALTAAPNSATWTVFKVVGGELIDVGGIGLAPISDLTTIGVRLEGARIDTYVDGTYRSTLLDDTHLDATLVGLTVRGEEASAASWTNFVAVAEFERPTP